MDANCSQRFFQVSSCAAKPAILVPEILQHGRAGDRRQPRSVITRFAAARSSVLRKSSSTRSVISTYLMPALAQPSSDLAIPCALRSGLVDAQNHFSGRRRRGNHVQPGEPPGVREALFVEKA